jgi:hypothetical protein
VTAGNNRFTYAAIFCAIAALIGTTITIAPRFLEIVRGQMDKRRNSLGEAEDEVGQAGRSKSGRTTPA